MDQTLQRVNCPIQTRFQHLDLVTRHRLQHIVGGILSRRRTADSDFDSDELRRPQRLDDRLDPIVSSMPSGQLDPQPARLQIKIVMDDDEILGRELEFSEKAFEGRAAEIHPIQRPGKFNQLGSKPSTSTMSKTTPGKTDGPPSGSPLDGPHTDIVESLGVGVSRIA